MGYIRLIHWNAAETKERAAKLRRAGYDVAYESLDTTIMRQLRNDPPAAVVIDLARRPSQGRDVALAIRLSKTTRYVPLVFVDGDPEKVARIQEHLPDALYTTWRHIQSALKRAIAHPPTNPVVPRSGLEGYSGTPLPKKLGIKANSVVALVGSPEDFERTLGELPEGVVLRRQARSRFDLLIWFTISRKDLERQIERRAAQIGKGGLWIAWPKKTSKIHTDLSQVVVRRIGLAAGLVDYKVCSIDSNWSGLRFTRRKSK